MIVSIETIEAIGFVVWGFALVHMGFGSVSVEPVPYGVTIIFGGFF